jgi:exopolyphosphatase/guanosine-5'-triphosphate,3'-diphosphate pyrophosphatase
VALALFDGVRAALGAQADDDSRRELAWACALHEIGQMVSHHDHHRHSAYLLGHADAPGFSQSQQRHLAQMVLGQRGGLRKVEQVLTRRDVALQVLALRLAVIQCHARGAIDDAVLQLDATAHGVHLAYDADWAASHPRTLYLLQQESQAWDRGGVFELSLATT